LIAIKVLSSAIVDVFRDWNTKLHEHKTWLERKTFTALPGETKTGEMIVIHLTLVLYIILVRYVAMTGRILAKPRDLGLAPDSGVPQWSNFVVIYP
jgi:hypothetical protein